MNKENIIPIKRYCVHIEWNYTGEEEYRFERCFIFPSSTGYESMDGANMVGCKGMEGYSFDIYNSLEEAIVNAHFNPKHILFEGMEEAENKEIERVLNIYTWNQFRGLIKKEEN